MESGVLETLKQVTEPLLLPVILVILLSYSTKLILRFLNCKRLLRFSGLVVLFWAQLLSFAAKINIFHLGKLCIRPLWLGNILTGLIIQALSNTLYDTVVKQLDRTYVKPNFESDSSSQS